MCVEKLKFQQQILKHFDVFQWGRKKLWRRSCPYCFPGTTVKRLASSTIPKSSNMRNVSKYVSHKNLQPQLLKRSRWSHSPRSRETSRAEKLATAPLRLWTNPKKLHFCNTCACCCCLSKKKFFLLSAIPLQSEIRERLHKNLVSVLIQVIR